MQVTKAIIIMIIITQIYFTGEMTLHVAKTVNTEQLQHCEPKKHGWFLDM
jgi:hypothetical protein